MITKIQQSPARTVLSAMLLGLTVLLLSHLMQRLTLPFIEPYLDLSHYQKNVVFKFYILMLSLIGIFLVFKNSTLDFGFRFPEKTNYLRISLQTIGVTSVSMIVGGILFLGVLAHIFPTENNTALPETTSFLERVIAIWIVSSVCEEVLVRGLVQSLMDRWKTIKLFRLSLPVLASGLFFGGMHLSLLLSGMGPWFVCYIVFFTSAIGILAAFYREKSKSLLPPILIHILANVVGSLPILLNLMLE